MVTIDCPPQILVVSDMWKDLISNTANLNLIHPTVHKISGPQVVSALFLQNVLCKSS